MCFGRYAEFWGKAEADYKIKQAKTDSPVVAAAKRMGMILEVQNKPHSNTNGTDHSELGGTRLTPGNKA